MTTSWPTPPARLLAHLQKDPPLGTDRAQWKFELGPLHEFAGWAYYSPAWHWPKLPVRQKNLKCSNHVRGTAGVPRATLWYRSQALCDGCAKRESVRRISGCLVALRQNKQVVWTVCAREPNLKLSLPRAVRQWVHEQAAGTEATIRAWEAVEFKDLRFAPTSLDLECVLRAVRRGYLTLRSTRVDTTRTPLTYHVVRTEVPLTAPPPARNSSTLPWTETEHFRLAEAAPAAKHMAWLAELVERNMHPSPRQAVEYIRALARALDGKNISRTRRWELRQLLWSQQSIELLAALALVVPVYENGKLVRFVAADPQAALAVAQHALAWPGALTTL